MRSKFFRIQLEKIRLCISYYSSKHFLWQLSLFSRRTLSVKKRILQAENLLFFSLNYLLRIDRNSYVYIGEDEKVDQKFIELTYDVINKFEINNDDLKDILVSKDEVLERLVLEVRRIYISLKQLFALNYLSPETYQSGECRKVLKAASKACRKHKRRCLKIIKKLEHSISKFRLADDRIEF